MKKTTTRVCKNHKLTDAAREDDEALAQGERCYLSALTIPAII